MFFRPKFTLLLLLGACIAASGCGFQGGFFKQSDDGNLIDEVEVKPKSDKNGVVVADVSADSTGEQVLSASKKSKIKGASVKFPPGSLSVNTELSMEEGSNIVSAKVSKDLGLGDKDKVSKASKAVVLKSKKKKDAAQPFVLQLPIDSDTGLLLADPNRKLVIVYKVYKYEEGGKLVAGVLTKDQFEYDGKNVIFKTRFFGSYQAVVSEEFIEKPKEVKTKEAIVTKNEEEEKSSGGSSSTALGNLAFNNPTQWSSVSYPSYQTVTFTLKNSGSGSATSITMGTLPWPWSYSNNACGSTLAAGASCTVAVNFNSPGAGTFSTTLSATYHNGAAADQSTSVSLSATGTASSVTVEKIYSTHGDWLDFVRNDNSNNSIYDQAGTLCDGTETGGPSSCLHSGEMLKVVVSGVSSCAELSASDSLGAFDWNCRVSGSDVHFVTSRLKDNKALADLVNATSWKSNSVTVWYKGYEAASSSSTTWWNNTVQALPDSTSGVVTLGAPYVKKILTLSAGAFSEGYNIDADQVAIVTLAGAKLKTQSATTNCNSSTGEISSPNQVCLVSAGSQKFLWIEGYFDGNGTVGNIGVLLSSCKHVRMRRVNAGNFSSYGFFFVTVSHSRFDLLKATNNGNIGIYCHDACNYNVFTKLYSTNNVSQGLYLAYGNAVSSTNNVFSDLILSANGQEGLRLVRAQNNTFSYLMIANNYGSGVWLNNTATNNTFVNLTSINNASVGVYLSTSDLTGNNFYNAMIAHNGGSAIDIANVNNASSWSGVLKVSGSCVNNAGTLNGLDTSCGSNTGSTLTTTNSINLASTFVNRVATDDSGNGSDASGSATYSANMDWFKFENGMRYWGLDHATDVLTSSTARGRCSTGTCRIVDVSLKNSDTVALGALGTSLTPSAACPAAIAGSVYVADNNSITGSFLRLAKEVMGDASGNDNGLCESNETCTYAPDLGIYQGHGDFTSSSCTFTDGTVSGVVMYGYPSRGY